MESGSYAIVIGDEWFKGWYEFEVFNDGLLVDRWVNFIIYGNQNSICSSYLPINLQFGLWLW